MTDQKDIIVRALTDNGGFRVIGARTTRTVRGIIDAQKPAASVRDVLGQMSTCAILTRETMAPGQRVQAILKSNQEKGSVVADSHPGGVTRGLVSKDTTLNNLLGEKTTLQVVRTMPGGKLHQGVVSVPTNGGVTDAFMSYMHNSEQVTTMIASSCYFVDDELMVAGGYCVQVLPEVAKDQLEIMATRLEGFGELEKTLETSAGDVDEMLSEILYGIPFTVVERTELGFGCTCNEIRVIGALATLGRAEIESIVEEGKLIELNCDYCRTEYKISPAKLKGLLEGS